MCICISEWDLVYVYKFNGYHSGGSSFVNVNDCWYYKNCLYTIDISSALKIYIYIYI